MSPTTSLPQIAHRYLAFASEQTDGVSPSFSTWARAIAADPEIQSLLVDLPREKQQPNLVFAAARRHGASPGDPASLRQTLTRRWDDVRRTILSRSTQTNEAARCVLVVLGLQKIDGPIALLEVGASAGLCLLPDRYSYAFSDGSHVDPVDGPSAVTMNITVDAGFTSPARMPDLVWRAGLDLNPLDPADPDDLAWLEALVWPEHEERRQRLVAAARIAASSPAVVHRGDLLTDLPELAATAPQEATLVITHSATLAYLTDEQRRQATAIMNKLGDHTISFEGRGVDPRVREVDVPLTPDTLFVAALDGNPYAVANGHGDRLRTVTAAPPDDALPPEPTAHPRSDARGHR